MYTQWPTTNTEKTNKGVLNTVSLDTLKEQMQQMLLQNEQLLASFERMSISTNENTSVAKTATEVA